MRKLFPAFVLALLVIPAPASAQLTLTMEGGMVTLIAKDVPLSAIMAEWAKVGKTNIVNGDKIFTAVTLHLENVPERKALDILLRNAAGYMIAERPMTVAGGSAFDRIMILPTSRPPANAPPLQPPTPAPFAPPRPMPVPVQDDQEPTSPNVPQQNPMVPGQPGMAQPGMAQPGMAQPGMAQPGSPNTPQAPITAPRPGMITPPPQQPVPFGTPRPPGGGGGGTPTNPTGSGGGGGGA